MAAVLVAAALRLPRLADRPMHTDEAVHAVKFGRLLEEGLYEYDPHEYHGPTLNFFTLVAARLTGKADFARISEVTMRIVPAVFGIALVAMSLLLIDGLGKYTVAAIAVLTAISPAFVFYSRYYIQEMLLVFFTFGVIGCGWRYVQTKKLLWAVLTGLCAGLMHATKETCIIAFGSMLLAIVFTMLVRRSETGPIETIKKNINPWHAAAALTAAIAISALFFSSFFTDPKGILDSVMCYGNYFSRAGTNRVHIHPWYYYLDLLTHIEFFEKLTWNEDLIVVLAAVGFIAAILRRPKGLFNSSLLTFIAFYTFLMTAIYSAIPYKTPWCMLGFLHGMILLAGVGVVVLAKTVVARWEKLILWSVLIVFGALSLAGQSLAGSFFYYAKPSNPYVYAHTGNDIFNIVDRIEQIADVHPQAHDIYIEVICPEEDYWPLPWYLRSFSHIGYRSKVDPTAPAAPVIIALADVQPELLSRLYELPPPGEKHLYMPLFDSYTELRPQVELRGYIIKDVADLLDRQTDPPLPESLIGAQP